MLLNLFRGCGLKGISGIPAVRGKVIRPLLECERSEILDFLSERRLDYRQDRTNFLTEYTRNKIRLKFIPYVEREINKGALEHICRAAESALEAEKYIERKTEEKYPDCVRILESAQGKKAVLNAGRLIQTEEILRKQMCIRDRNVSKKLPRTCLRQLFLFGRKVMRQKAKTVKSVWQNV